MTNCTFTYRNHTKCEQPAIIKKVDKENSIVDRVTDGKGKTRLCCWHPVLKYGPYCFNHTEMMAGRLLPVEQSRVPVRTLKTIAMKREVWQETFEKKKRLSHAKCGL